MVGSVRPRQTLFNSICCPICCLDGQLKVSLSLEPHPHTPPSSSSSADRGDAEGHHGDISASLLAGGNFVDKFLAHGSIISHVPSALKDSILTYISLFSFLATSVGKFTFIHFQLTCDGNAITEVPVSFAFNALRIMTVDRSQGDRFHRLSSGGRRGCISRKTLMILIEQTHTLSHGALSITLAASCCCFCLKASARVGVCVSALILGVRMFLI